MKIKLIRVLLVLLCLLPATIGAQSLNRFEYWFDDNYAGRRTGSLSGSDLVINRAIPTTGLDYGVHRFNLRVRRSDNMYSAVTSQLFLKLDRGTSNTVEYWFDDNFDEDDDDINEEKLDDLVMQCVVYMKDPENQ